MTEPDAVINELSLNVTARCAGHCRYCPLTDEVLPVDPETDRLVGILTESAALGVTSLCATGGEPFLSPALAPILAEATKLGVNVQISSSGVGVTPALVERLASGLDPSHPTEVTISLDSLDAETTRRLGRPSAAQAVEAVSAFQKAGWPWVVSVNLVLSSENLTDALEVARFCRDRGIGFGVQRLSVRLPGGRRLPEYLAVEPGDTRLTNLIETLKEMAAGGLQLTNSVPYLASLLTAATGAPCPSAGDRLCVTAGLDAHTCWLLPAVGSLATGSVVDVWRSEAAARSRALMGSGACPGCGLRCFGDA